MALLVGLTGGIGSGKTVVSDYFSELGIPIIDTDIVAREIVSSGSATLKKLAITFGKEIIDDKGALNRDALRKAAFSDLKNKQKLDHIMHPVIRKQTFKKINQANHAYCIVVVPLLIETDFKELVDRILVVTADKQNRINWIKKRSALSTGEVKDIMQTQTQDEIRLQFADDIIQNNASLAEVEAQVAVLHQKYLQLAEAKQTS